MANITISSIWPEWQIEKFLGDGSYGEVYKAVRRDHLESYAAIKVISIPKNESEVNTLRSEGMRYDETETYFKNVVNDFVKEIQLMETFKGTQNIVSVEDYKVVKKENELGWDIYIRMELLTPLDQYFRDHFPDESETIKIGIDICTALEMCAKRRVIHRDIKPENIFVNSFGDFKLGDFGIARTLGNASTSMTQAGSPNYLAPEITKSSRYDATVDIYSLGLVLYRYTNDNRLPFMEPGQNTSPLERQRALIRRFEGEPLSPPCNASQNLAEVILTACAYDPARRYKTPTEMKNMLIGIANGTYKSTNMYRYFELAKQAYDETRAVRPVEGAQEPYYAAPFDSTAGNSQPAARPRRVLDTSLKPEVERRRRAIKRIKIAIAVCAVTGVLILIFGAIIPQLPKKNHETNSGSSSTVETIKYSASDEQKIAEIIKEAEVFASNDDYDGAYEKIKAGLITYPKSASLMEKEQEYYNICYRRDTLATAKMFAEMDSLPEAIIAIKDAQAKQGDCPEYQAALAEYTAAYKTAVTAEADAAAANEDYAAAVKAVNEAISILGGDTELSAKSVAFENSYVSSVVTQVDALIAKEDYAGASAVLEPALEAFPNNETLKWKLKLLEGSSYTEYLFDEDPYMTENICLSQRNNDSKTITDYGSSWYYSDSDNLTLSSGGVEYNKGMNVIINNSNKKAQIYYNLNSKYSSLRGKIAAADTTKQDRIDKSYIINIYADDTRIGSYTIVKGDLPIDFQLDVNSCKKLTIEFVRPEGDASRNPSINLIEFQLKATTNWQEDSGDVTEILYSSYLFDTPPYMTENICLSQRNNDSKTITDYGSSWYYSDSDNLTLSSGGVEYNKGMNVIINNSNKKAQIYYNLNSKYSSLRGKIAAADTTKQDRIDKSYIINIYADDTRIGSYTIVKGDLPIDFQLDVNSCKKLTVEFVRPEGDVSRNPSINLINFRMK